MQMAAHHIQHDQARRQSRRIPEILCVRGLHSDHRIPKRFELERTDDLPPRQERVLHRSALAPPAPALALDRAQQEQALHHARVPQENHRQKAQLALDGLIAAASRGARQADMIKDYNDLY